MAAGRKLLPMADPRLPLQKFAWLVRAIRSFHHDADLRNTVRFTDVLNRSLTEPLKPATVNRLETGQADFTIERCRAYEDVLQLEPLDLVDCYLYACRLENRTPKTRMSSLRETTGAEMELIWNIASGEELNPEQWLRMAYLFRNRPDLFSSARVRERFLHHLLDSAGNCYEKEERLVREILITTGEEIVPLLRERIKEQPLRYFNMCESFGFIPNRAGRDFLVRLFGETQDGAVTANILESIRRNMQVQHEGFEDLAGDAGALRHYAVAALNRTDEFYTAREESLTFLRWARVDLTPRERTQMSQVGEDITQLEVRTTAARRKEVVHEIGRRFSGILADSALPETGLPSHVPGLRHFVEDALFAADRVGRLSASVLVRPWPLSKMLGAAVGKTLLDTVEAKEYGIQRASVRFLTKLMHPECLDPVRKIGWSNVRDDSVRLTVGWALGTGTADRDSQLLEHLGRTATTTPTRRVVAIAAARLGAAHILEELAQSKDPEAAASARQFMGSARTQ